MVHRGLEGVEVAETRISRVDGARGALHLAGMPIEDLVAEGLLAAITRLWSAAGRPLPTDLREALGAARSAAFSQLPQAAPALALEDGMSALRAGVELLSPEDAVSIISAVSVFTAAWVRARQGRSPIVPDPSRSPAEDLLRMLLGDDVSSLAARSRALEAYLTAVTEHGMNASTFTARAVTSTGATDRAAVTAAIAALSGPLHGGAPGPVLDMLDAIGAASQAEPWIKAELSAGRRIMGIGHRVYRVRDPRAAVLETAAHDLAEAGVGGERLALARAVEAAAVQILSAHKPDRPLYANVEFATAVLLEAIGIPRAAFTLCFTCGRVIGWLAHTAEERRDGRLIRPRAVYVGA
ncbi:MAG: citrate synthase [Myxococcota bacterium]